MIGIMNNLRAGKSELVLVSFSNWMYGELSSQHAIPVRRSYGLDVPVHGFGTAWWMPQATAAHFLASGADLYLYSPPADWLDSLPYRYKGRVVVSLQVKDLDRDCVAGLGFCKLATGKLEEFPAKVRSYDSVVSLVRKLNLPDDCWLQFSEVIEIDREFRFFVDEGKIMTGCSYLAGNVTYYDGLTENHALLAGAEAFLLGVFAASGERNAMVVDVGWRAGIGFFVLEANPAWCSAWYACDIEKVVDCILTANRCSEVVTLDASLTVRASVKQPLKLLVA